MVSADTVGLVEYDADEILERMRHDHAHGWPGRLWRDMHRAGELTGGEVRILTAYSHGMNCAETAELYGVSPWTVDAQIKMVRRRLAAKTTAHAVAIAIRRGLIV